MQKQQCCIYVTIMLQYLLPRLCRPHACGVRKWKHVCCSSATEPSRPNGLHSAVSHTPQINFFPITLKSDTRDSCQYYNCGKLDSKPYERCEAFVQATLRCVPASEVPLGWYARCVWVLPCCLRFYAVCLSVHRSSLGHIKNVDIPYPRFWGPEKTRNYRQVCPRITQTFTTCSSNCFLKFLRFQKRYRTNSKRYDILLFILLSLYPIICFFWYSIYYHSIVIPYNSYVVLFHQCKRAW